MIANRGLSKGKDEFCELKKDHYLLSIPCPSTFCMKYAFTSTCTDYLSVPTLIGYRSSLTCTRKTYSAGQKSYLDFIRLHPHLQQQRGSLLPASQTAVMECVGDLGRRGLQPRTING